MFRYLIVLFPSQFKEGGRGFLRQPVEPKGILISTSDKTINLHLTSNETEFKLISSN